MHAAKPGPLGSHAFVCIFQLLYRHLEMFFFTKTVREGSDFGIIHHTHLSSRVLKTEGGPDGKFPLVNLDFEYLALTQLYTIFWCQL